MKKLLIFFSAAGLIGSYALYTLFGQGALRSGRLIIHPEGGQCAAVAEQLVDSGFVERGDALVWLCRLKDISTFPPGIYRIEQGDPIRNLFNRFRSGAQHPIQLTITSCGSLDVLSRKLAAQLMEDSAAFSDYLHSEDAGRELGLEPHERSSVILPNTYEVYWTMSPEQFLDRMQVESERYWSSRDSLRERIGLSRVEVVTLASIVQAETNRTDEMPRVAGLYLNRIREGWKLESDPTAVYGFKKSFPDSVIRRVLHAHVRFPSPWNTYLNAGLPPGPISIPSLQAVEAVIHAERHAYFFMVASVERPGYHEFSRADQFGRHQRMARKYQQYLNRRKL